MRIRFICPILFLGTLMMAGCHSTEVKREQESQREDIRELQSRIDDVHADMVSIQSENQALKSEIARLKDDLHEASSSNDQYQKDIQRLDGLVKKLDTAREQDRKIIVEEVSSEINNISKKMQAAVSAQNAKPAEKSEGVEHVVAKGDTLFGISKAYHVSVDEIREVNKLKSNVLSVGQKLFIPAPAK